MAATITYYNSFATDLGDNNIDLGVDSFKVTLHTSAYTIDIDVHNRYDDLTNELLTAGGYTAGGQALASVTWVQDNANDRTIWDFADPEWTSSTLTARYAVIRKDRGGAASADELVCQIDFGGDQTTSASTFRIALNALGFLAMQQA